MHNVHKRLTGTLLSLACSTALNNTPATRDTEPMMASCWASVTDACPTLNHHCFKVLCLLGQDKSSQLQLPSGMLSCNKRQNETVRTSNQQYYPGLILCNNTAFPLQARSINTIPRPTVDPMLAHRRRRWASIGSTVGHHILFIGCRTHLKIYYIPITSYSCVPEDTRY